MPMDAACLAAVVQECRPAVEEARIDKIFQPARDEIVLLLRGGQRNEKLLLTANPSHPRIQLTRVNRENPANPPMFCMLLRKHLTGGRILSLTQPPMERMVDLEIETRNELGDQVTCHLILEAMGRRSNLILTGPDNRIIDCIRRIDGDLSQQRPVRWALPAENLPHLRRASGRLLRGPGAVGAGASKGPGTDSNPDQRPGSDCPEDPGTEQGTGSH